MRIALAKQDIGWEEAFFRGVQCNVLVCMAVWMAAPDHGAHGP